MERGESATLVVANSPLALSDDPLPVGVLLPDGRKVVIAAVEIALRFERQRDAWTPVLLQGVRIRAVELDGELLYWARRASDRPVVRRLGV